MSHYWHRFRILLLQLLHLIVSYGIVCCNCSRCIYPIANVQQAMHASLSIVNVKLVINENWLYGCIYLTHNHFSRMHNWNWCMSRFVCCCRRCYWCGCCRWDNFGMHCTRNNHHHRHHWAELKGLYLKLKFRDLHLHTHNRYTCKLNACMQAHK